MPLHIRPFIFAFIALLVSSACHSNDHIDLPPQIDPGTKEDPYPTTLDGNNTFSGLIKKRGFYRVKLPEPGAYDIHLNFDSDTRIAMSIHDWDSSGTFGVSCAYTDPKGSCVVKGIFTSLWDASTMDIELSNYRTNKSSHGDSFTIYFDRVDGEMSYDFPVNEPVKLRFSENVMSSKFQVKIAVAGDYRIKITDLDSDTGYIVLANILSLDPRYQESITIRDIGSPCSGEAKPSLVCNYFFTENSEFEISVHRDNSNSYLPLEFTMEIVGP